MANYNHMNNNLQYSSEVRKKILSMLMFQLYSDERTIYREYVQNALDSISMAVQSHILNQAKEGLVTINIDDKNKRIKIKDNGVGINAANAVRTLLDISPSNKDGVNQAGMYGIGRLVGGGYCHELIFRTSARGETIGTQITFDVDRIWKMVAEDEKDYLATEVINECTKREIISSDESDHFFEVILNGVKSEAAPSLLNTDEIIEYLREVAPVEYKPEFKNTLIYKSTLDNPEYNSLHENIEKVQVFVGNVRIQKQYGLTIKGTKDKINNLEYFKIETPEYGMLGWGWYALTKYTIQIKGDSLAGIRLRAHNIQVGDSSLLSGTKYWKEERGNSYFYGEFFVTHPNIRPNGARDGLVPTPETSALNKGLREYFDNLKTLYTKANEGKKCIDKINEGIKRIDDNGGVVDIPAKDLINNRGIGKFEKLMNSTYGFEAIKKMLLLYQPDYIESKKEAEEKLKKSNSLQEKSDVKVHTTKDVKVHSTQENSDNNSTPLDTTNPLWNEVSQEGNKNSDNISSSTYIVDKEGASVASESLINPQVVFVTPKSTLTPLRGHEDIFASLNGILDAHEIWMLRRVFKVLNYNCPDNEHDKELISQMERLIIKEFGDER